MSEVKSRRRSEGNLTKRVGKTGVVSYRLRYRCQNEFKAYVFAYKTVRQEPGETESELKKRATRILSDIYRVSREARKAPTKQLLSNYLASWLDSIAPPTVSAKTHERYGELLNNHVVPHIGNIPLLSLRADDIQKLYSKLLANGRINKIESPKKRGEESERLNSGLSGQTVLHIHRVLSQALKRAFCMDLIPKNPATQVRPPRAGSFRAHKNSDESSEVIMALSKERLGELLQGFRDSSIFPIVAVAAATGLRRGEILALRWIDIDLEKGTLMVSRSVEETHVHGVRIKKDPKNKSSKRTIGIDPTLIGILKAHRKALLEEAFGLGVRLGNEALVFPKSVLQPTQPTFPRHVTQSFVAKAANLGFPGMRFHDLRHTHATILLSEGVPVNTVSQRLGHATPVITLSTYGHVLKRSEDQAVAVAGGIWTGSKSG